MWLRTLHLSVLLEKWEPQISAPVPSPGLTLGNTEGSSDVASHRQEVNTKVKERVVIGFNTIVLQGHSAIELVSCVHLKLARGNIHDVGDAQLQQLALVPGRIAVGRSQGERGCGARPPWISSGRAATCALPSSAISLQGERLEPVDWPTLKGLLKLEFKTPYHSGQLFWRAVWLHASKALKMYTYFVQQASF